MLVTKAGVTLALASHWLGDGMAYPLHNLCVDRLIWQPETFHNKHVELPSPMPLAALRFPAMLAFVTNPRPQV